jgi:hypothetical protein
MLLVLALTVAFLLLLATLVLVALNFQQTQAANAEEEENEMTSEGFINFLVSFLNHISGEIGGEQLNITDSSGLMTFATTKKHRIVLIPTYHDVQDRVNAFLAQPKQPNDLYIVLDGEPNQIPRHPSIDLTITTKKDLLPTDIYVPYYCMYSAQFCKPLGQLFEPTIPVRSCLQDWFARSFIVFCYSNSNTTRYSGCADRSRFYQTLVRKVGSRVSNAGKQCAGDTFFISSNNPSPKQKSKKQQESHYSGNDSLYKKFKFVVAFENCQIKGYISEKMINPLLAGAIPVYLGAPDIDEHINPNCFINVNQYDSFEACIDDLLAIEQDVGRVTSILSAKPFLHDRYLDYLKTKGGSFWPLLSESSLGYLVPIHRRIVNRLSFVTFKYDKDSSAKRIQKEATASGFFDDVVCLRTQNIPYDFLQKHHEFIKSHPSFDIWKSVCLLNQLRTMCENDLLLYVHPSLHLPHGIHWLKSQVEPLLQSEKGILAMQTNDLEVQNTKKLCLQTLCMDYQVKINDLLETKYVSGDWILLKKCKRTMDFLTKWSSYASQYPLVDNTTSQEDSRWKEHKNDGSIFSCLMKLHSEWIS